EIISCTRYARITSTKSLRVRDTPEQHLRNRSVYPIRPKAPYENLPRTRHARIPPTKNLRERHLHEYHHRPRNACADPLASERPNLRTSATAQKGTRPQLDGCHSHIY